MGWVSPNDMLKAAKEHMLEGREPESREDWMLIMNFFAANVDSGSAEPACQLMCAIYDMPLSKVEVKEIVRFQLAQLN